MHYCRVLAKLFVAILTIVIKLISIMFITSIDHWSSPNVSGDKPPPVDDFTLTKIADERSLLYGGDTAQGESSDLRVATVLGDSVVSVCVH